MPKFYPEEELYETCPECEGQLEVELENGTVVPCTTCDGTGEVEKDILPPPAVERIPHKRKLDDAESKERQKKGKQDFSEARRKKEFVEGEDAD